MPRRLLPILLSCLSAAFAATSAQAELEWAKPIQEFHRSPEDNQIVATYAFKNTGPSAVTILRVATSCGCTTARTEQKTLAPGDAGAIEVKFVFGFRRGEQRKGIAVSTNDGRIYSLELRCAIEEPLKIFPALVFWRIGDPLEARLVELQLAHPSETKIIAVTSSTARIRAALAPGENGATRHLRLEVTDTQQKEVATVTIQTNFPPDAPNNYVLPVRIK